MSIRRAPIRTETEEDWAARIAEERRRTRDAVSTIIDAVVRADEGALYLGLCKSEGYGGLPQAIRALGRLSSVSTESKQMFLEFWLRYGDRLRQESGDDLALIRALRVVLPAYDGPALLLWRGEWAGNRRDCTYSLSWTSDREVATAFAHGHRNHAKGGMVLVEAFVQPEAIICAPCLSGDPFGEGEYLVDRRRLTGVRLIERFQPAS